MDSDPGFEGRREQARRLLQEVASLLEETEGALDSASRAPSSDQISGLEQLRGRLEQRVRSYLEQNAVLLDDMREHIANMEAAKKAAMAEKTPKAPRDQARIQELSEELTTKLRLERIDAAIKEILDFLADETFFAANASTGRRRKLRSLQNAIDKALQK